jgi:hypothetical protein
VTPAAPEQNTEASASLRANLPKVAVLLVGIAAFVFSPIPLCPLRRLLHVPCPGCGGTRAVFLALHGDIVGSIHVHPLALPAALWLVPTMIVMCTAIARGNPNARLPVSLRRGWGLLLIAMFVLWIARFFGAWGGPVDIT